MGAHSKPLDYSPFRYTKMACPVNCHCQWGMGGIFLGIFIVLAAGVFTFFPVFLDLFDYPWYIALCWAWFFIGLFFLAAGIIIECFDCGLKPKISARGADVEANKEAVAPTPYV